MQRRTWIWNRFNSFLDETFGIERKKTIQSRRSLINYFDSKKKFRKVFRCAKKNWVKAFQLEWNVYKERERNLLIKLISSNQNSDFSFVKTVERWGRHFTFSQLFCSALRLTYQQAKILNVASAEAISLDILLVVSRQQGALGRGS